MYNKRFIKLLNEMRAKEELNTEVLGWGWVKNFTLNQRCWSSLLSVVAAARRGQLRLNCLLTTRKHCSRRTVRPSPSLVLPPPSSPPPLSLSLSYYCFLGCVISLVLCVLSVCLSVCLSRSLLSSGFRNQFSVVFPPSLPFLRPYLTCLHIIVI